MSEQNYTVTINNKEIWEFFNQNPSIDIETGVLILIDIFDITFKNAENTISNKINTRILSSIAEQVTQIKDLRTDVGSLRQDMTKFNTDLLNSLLMRFSDVKKEYVNEMKTIMTCSDSNTLEKITSLIDKNNSMLVDKTRLLLGDIVPKSNDVYYRQIQENIQLFQQNIINETGKLLSSSQSDNSLTDFLSTFESKTAMMMQSVQTPIYNFITSSEERLNKNLTQIKDHTLSKDSMQGKVFDELTDFLNKNKYKNSYMKGKNSENQLEDILNQLFPSCLVEATGEKAGCGDFILQEREHGKANIMFENKDYTHNVPTIEVNKFIRDMRQNACNGVFISENSGIVTKQQFQVEIIDGLIAVYVLNCNYEHERVKIAVDIIDTLSSCLSKFIGEGSDGENLTITSEMLAQINTEYSKFSLQRTNLCDNVRFLTKEMTKKMIEQIEEIKFPSLETFLSNKFGGFNVSTEKDNVPTCKYCKKTWPNSRSLASHMKGCSKKGVLTNEATLN